MPQSIHVFFIYEMGFAVKLSLIVCLIGVLFYSSAKRQIFGVDRSLIDGKHIFLTGGGSGIGAAFAFLATKEGADIFITGRRKKRLEEVCRKINDAKHKGKCMFGASDIGDLDYGAKYILKIANETMRGIDVIISNHVSGRTAKLSEIKEDELYQSWLDTYKPNVFGVMALARHGVPYLLERAKEGPMKPGFVQVSEDMRRAITLKSS